MRNWNQFRSKRTVLLGALLLAALFFAFPAFAGWNTSGKQITYTDAAGLEVTGLQTIDGRVYFFNEAGVLQTGWAATPDGIRYFREDGKTGARLGSMVAGNVVKIKDAWYGFGEDGIVLTGFQTIGKYSYYFTESDKPGVCGKAAVNTFRELPDGRRVFLREDGRMAVSQWIKDHKYYVDETGNVLRNSVTKDGYLLDSGGKAKKKLTDSEFVRLSGKWYFYRKKKGLLKDRVFKYKNNYYYVDSQGVRQSGWITWRGHDYYFESDGKAVTGKKTIDGESYKFNKQGQLRGTRVDPAAASALSTDTDPDTETPASGTKESTGKASVLILCGHGQGDIGAVGLNGKYVESEYTRDFGKRIYEALQKAGRVNVELFNTGYDMFQQMRSVVGSAGSFTGSGKKRKKVLAAVKTNPRIPDLKQFDYVLEVHFNATVANKKDPKGDGSKKGTGTYVNIYKPASQRKVDQKIISAFNGLGLNTWGNGVNNSAGLLNAKVFTELGINYSLLETCFIDDKDDMKFYLKKRDEMAEAVANAVADYFA